MGWYQIERGGCMHTSIIIFYDLTITNNNNKLLLLFLYENTMETPLALINNKNYSNVLDHHFRNFYFMEGDRTQYDLSDEMRVRKIERDGVNIYLELVRPPMYQNMSVQAFVFDHYDCIILNCKKLSNSKFLFINQISEMWKDMNLYKNKGFTRKLGIKNFNVEQINSLIDVCTEKSYSMPEIYVSDRFIINPTLNEIILENNMKTYIDEPFSVLTDSRFDNIAKKYNVNNESVLISYLFSRKLYIVTDVYNFKYIKLSKESTDLITEYLEQPMNHRSSFEFKFNFNF